ncbi:cupin domain-containing protein [Pseudomaricurvus alcaniphilus]|uniref:cupin domain-containing protein n=1 Tax=Pseudomaricurvus alcaniphilus TaxID=1166482 RepID=UPI00140B23D8|nr:cupin domain-containing protein [Pseudomaricurvus alcaniphilus]NHN39146.1 cupin domain-containing protein [Pseudomaricurvus alcaniphilus]
MARKAVPIRRVVTGHDDKGRAVFRSKDVIQPETIPSGDADFATLWSTAQVPVDLNDETDGRDRDAGLTLNGGSVIRVTDMLPGGESPMHRTNSIDYGIILAGTVELELDDGVVETCRAGDVIVQRGTIHLWRNPSKTETCRIIFVLIEARGPYLHDGQPLAELKP